MRIGIRGNGYRLLALSAATDSIRYSLSTCALLRMLLTDWRGICFTRWRAMGRSWNVNRFYLDDLSISVRKSVLAPPAAHARNRCCGRTNKPRAICLRELTTFVVQRGCASTGCFAVSDTMWI